MLLDGGVQFRHAGFVEDEGGLFTDQRVHVRVNLWRETESGVYRFSRHIGQLPLFTSANSAANVQFQSRCGDANSLRNENLVFRANFCLINLRKRNSWHFVQDQGKLSQVHVFMPRS